jgi:hypothetical protein
LTGIWKYGYIGGMKTTIDIPDDIYRRAKAKSATEGRTVREVATCLFSAWVTGTGAPPPDLELTAPALDGQPLPPWFGALRKYAANARGRFDMDSIRRSISRGRQQEEWGS